MFGIRRLDLVMVFFTALKPNLRHPALRMQRNMFLCEFQDSFIYILNSGTARAVGTNLVSKQNKIVRTVTETDTFCELPKGSSFLRLIRINFPGKITTELHVNGPWTQVLLNPGEAAGLLWTPA